MEASEAWKRTASDFDSRRTYQGVESPDGFAGREALEEYRTLCLGKCANEGRLIDPLLNGSELVLEIGCGNGRNLIHLAEKRLLASGLGMDIASSRIGFAKDWAEDLGHGGKIEFRDTDVMALPEAGGPYDLVLCITAAFGYFGALEAGGDAKVLRWMADNLKPGGRMVMELYLYPKEVALMRAHPGEPLRHWSELPAKDPFRFYLHERWWDDSKRILYHKKMFIHRSGRVDEGRGDSQRIYTLVEITALLASAGLEIEEVCGDWGGHAYAEGDEILILRARKSG